MIPISLTIKGLFSYQNEQTIYFDRLVAGQLFGIFGPVGSGKSTILEAIAFALYGETERLHLRDDRNYNMMNLKSDELLIDFIFQNFDEVRYRFIVRGKRNSKKFDKVNTFERKAYQFTAGSWQPKPYVTAEEVLGLSYENFRRTIIIPQGKFQEFLQLTDKARTEMLKDIFQLDRFEFFQQTASLERKNNENIQLLKGRLSAFEEVNDEQLEVARSGLEGMEEALSIHRRELQEEELAMKEQEQLRLLFQELDQVKQRHEVLAEKATYYDRVAHDLGDFEYCERHFKADLLRLDELEKGIAKRKLSLTEYEQQLNSCNTHLMTLLQEHANITKQVQELEGLKEKRQDYTHGISLLKLDMEIGRLDERLKKGKVFLEKAQTDKLNAEKTGARLRATLQQKKQEKPAVGLLTDLKNWFKQLEHLEESLEAKNQEQQSLQEELDKQQALAKQLRQEASVGADVSLALRLAELDKKTASIQEEINHCRLQLKLSDFAAALHRGEACPLCGSSEHPHILEVKDVKDQLKSLEAAQEALFLEQKRYQEFDRQQVLLEARINDLQERKKQLDQQQAVQGELIQRHMELFNWSGYSPTDAAKVEQQFQDLKRLEELIEQLEKELRDNEETLKQAESARDQYSEGLRRITDEYQKNQGAFQLLTGQLRALTINEVKNASSAESFELVIKEIDAHISEVTRQNESVQQSLQNQQQLKIILEERLNAVRNNVEVEQERLYFIKDKLNQALQLSKFKQLEEVKAVLGKAWDIEKIKQEITVFYQQFYHVKEQAEKLNGQIAGKTFDEAYFQSLLEALKKRRATFEAETAKLLAHKRFYEGLLKQREEKAKLSQALSVLTSRAEHIGLLKNLFKGNGFISFVSSVYLQQLCEAANKRFYPLTRQQLKLELTERNEFQVRDYLNDGKVRLAKTLSGGQTFQASLSLALALAESVQQQNKARQNFFFLDEGFGSLDKESLTIAFDTLKSLRKENRIVGIISHVEELQQEIDVFLQIQNDAMLGTKVKGSWET